MKILAIADRKPEGLKELLDKNSFDLIITLGDLYGEEIKEIKDYNCLKVGVYGNHCNIYDGGYMNQLGIKNLHIKTVEFGGYIIGGFEGCVKYKEQEHFLYTQKEANELIKKLKKIDILISHCPPKGINDNDDIAHEGFEALKNYIDKYNPKYLLHGHTYDKGNFITKYKNTEIFYVNGYRIVEIENNSI